MYSGVPHTELEYKAPLVNNGRLQSRFQQLFVTWLLAVATFCCIVPTILFALNVSLQNPFSLKLLPSTPGTTILILNILSHLSVFLLSQLSGLVLEALRWSLASSRSGITAFGFLALGRATNVMGVARLLFRSTRKEGDLGHLRNEHRLWGFQR